MGVRALSNLSRAMLFYFANHWPNPADKELWPFIVDHTMSLWNTIPHTMSKLNPIELLTKKPHYDELCLQWLYVFGSQVYVFDPKLQDRKKFPKWCQGVFMMSFWETVETMVPLLPLSSILRLVRSHPIIISSSMLDSPPSFPTVSSLKIFGTPLFIPILNTILVATVLCQRESLLFRRLHHHPFKILNPSWPLLHHSWPVCFFTYMLLIMAPKSCSCSCKSIVTTSSRKSTVTTSKSLLSPSPFLQRERKSSHHC